MDTLKVEVRLLVLYNASNASNKFIITVEPKHLFALCFVLQHSKAVNQFIVWNQEEPDAPQKHGWHIMNKWVTNFSEN